MARTLRTLALRLALCAAATWLVWRLGFDTGVLFMAGLVGVALARPLLDLASDLRHELRRAVHRHDEGRHYAFHDRRVRVHEAEDGTRWIRVDDARRECAIGDAALRRLAAQGSVRGVGRGAVPHIAAEALLARATAAADPRFAVWLARTVVGPAQRARERASSPRAARRAP